MNYRADIDGLRAIAVLSVVIFHAFPARLPGGFIGVDIFFVISGFLISTIIFSEVSQNQFSLKNFYIRRIRRLFPALILVMLFVLGVGWFMLFPDEYQQLGKYIASSTLFVTNFIIFDDVGYFDNAAETKPLLHLWSLAVEEQFYIIWPLLIIIVWKKMFNILLIICLFILISFGLNVTYVTDQPMAVFFLPVFRFWELLCGSILAYILYFRHSQFLNFKARIEPYLAKIIYRDGYQGDGQVASNLMSLAGLALIIFSVLYINETEKFPGYWALMPTVSAILIIAAGEKSYFNQLFLSNKIAVFFGLISYPLYLWHWVGLSFIHILEGETPHRDARIIAVLVSILLAYLTYYLVERNIRYSGRKYFVSASLVIIFCAIGSWGYYTYSSKGFESRYQGYALIHEALDDWEYPGELISAKLSDGYHYRAKAGNVDIVFLGDSHIEQYGPRVTMLTKNGSAKNVSFVTGGGCPPIPNVYEDKTHQHCKYLLSRLNQILAKNDVETIVIGASFNSYFFKNYYEYRDNDVEVSLKSNHGVALAKKSFYNFIEKLSEEYTVYVLLDIPVSEKFHPKTLLIDQNEKRPFWVSNLRVPSSYQFKFPVNQEKLEDEMVRNLKERNISFIRQSQLICPKNQCNALSQEGRPIYKDGGHMRPWFVREKMDVLDKVILK